MERIQTPIRAIEQVNDWKSFYETRVNSEYQDYFEDRYKVFLEYIAKHQSNPYISSKNIIELGCGIGSISKYFLKQGFQCTGFDISHDMVELANKNTNSQLFYQGDIFKEKYPCDITAVSHGVLEHFNDMQILEICKLHRGSIHYVPLDKYIVPSFGDERLLPYEYWLALVKPKEYFLFNNNYDLAFRV